MLGSPSSLCTETAQQGRVTAPSSQRCHRPLWGVLGDAPCHPLHDNLSFQSIYTLLKRSESIVRGLDLFVALVHKSVDHEHAARQ